jgi:enediyne biosynthesis thioesterase
VKTYEYKHIVGFEETNLVGNVYYANFISWQGRCREMFLREYAPDVLEMLKTGFALVTTRVSCEFIDELCAFDEVVIRMGLGAIKQNRISMSFDYYLTGEAGEKLVAKGEQEVACISRTNGSVTPVAVPKSLSEALQRYAEE